MNKAKIDKELFEKLAMEDVWMKVWRFQNVWKRDQATRKSLPKSLSMKHSYNDFKVPMQSAEQAELMRKDSLMRMGQTLKMPLKHLFPLDEFKENAEKRVRLDLLFSALLEKYELEVGEDDLNTFIDEEAEKYKEQQFDLGFKANLTA